eukprot:scaffold85493_cov60-Phaeocystis_antarctica.AAC.3
MLPGTLLQPHTRPALSVNHAVASRREISRFSSNTPVPHADDRSTSPSGSDRGRTCSTRQQLRLFTMDSDTMDSVDVDRHPCASKQVWIVRFARREQGWGRVRRRCKSISWRKKGSRWGLREDRTGRRT